MMETVPGRSALPIATGSDRPWPRCLLFIVHVGASRTLCFQLQNDRLNHPYGFQCVPPSVSATRDLGAATLDAVTLHACGDTVKALPLQESLIACYGGLLRCAENHLSCGCVRRVVLVGLELRTLFCCARVRSAAEARAYWEIARLVRLGFPNLLALS